MIGRTAMNPSIRGSGDETTRYVWVRRCSVCRVQDLYAAFGQAAHLDAGWPWRCPTCGGSEWIPARVELPTDAANQGRCPHAPGSGS